MSLVCKAFEVYYTIRYGVPISGHLFGEASYRKGSVDFPEYSGPVEFEDITCERCGHVDTGWRRQ